MAIQDGLQLATNWGVNIVVLESDAQSAIQSLKSP